jgi:hypothetical protein
MKKKKYDEDVPIYEVVVKEDDNTGFNLISFVADPAIQTMAMCFNKQGISKEYQFKANKDQQVMIGPAMIPNMNIVRKDENGNKYFLRFSEDTIRLMVNKFNSTGQTKKFNVDHSNKMVDAYINESWIIEDPYYDKSRIYGYSLPKGTWMISVKVNDTDFWNTDVKELGKYGFSIEGIMSEKPVQMSSQDELRTIEEWIDILNEDDWVKIDPKFKDFLGSI